MQYKCNKSYPKRVATSISLFLLTNAILYVCMCVCACVCVRACVCPRLCCLILFLLFASSNIYRLQRVTTLRLLKLCWKWFSQVLLHLRSAPIKSLSVSFVTFILPINSANVLNMFTARLLVRMLYFLKRRSSRSDLQRTTMSSTRIIVINLSCLSCVYLYISHG